jgi:hypothetical protein
MFDVPDMWRLVIGIIAAACGIVSTILATTIDTRIKYEIIRALRRGKKPRGRPPDNQPILWVVFLLSTAFFVFGTAFVAVSHQPRPPVALYPTPTTRSTPTPVLPTYNLVPPTLTPSTSPTPTHTLTITPTIALTPTNTPTPIPAVCIDAQVSYFKLILQPGNLQKKDFINGVINLSPQEITGLGNLNGTPVFSDESVRTTCVCKWQARFNINPGWLPVSGSCSGFEIDRLPRPLTSVILQLNIVGWAEPKEYIFKVQ